MSARLTSVIAKKAAEKGSKANGAINAAVIGG